MTGPEALAAFEKAMRLVKLGQYAEARAVEMLPSDRRVIEDKIAKMQNATLRLLHRVKPCQLGL